LGFEEVEAPEFLDNRHMNVVRLSALRTGRLYPPGKIPQTQRELNNYNNNNNNNNKNKNKNNNNNNNNNKKLSV
jgi:hypothetical protein